jgi:hypothetical protein
MLKPYSVTSDLLSGLDLTKHDFDVDEYVPAKATSDRVEFEVEPDMELIMKRYTIVAGRNGIQWVKW